MKYSIRDGQLLFPIDKPSLFALGQLSVLSQNLGLLSYSLVYFSKKLVYCLNSIILLVNEESSEDQVNHIGAE